MTFFNDSNQKIHLCRASFNPSDNNEAEIFQGPPILSPKWLYGMTQQIFTFAFRPSSLSTQTEKEDRYLSPRILDKEEGKHCLWIRMASMEIDFNRCVYNREKIRAASDNTAERTTYGWNALDEGRGEDFSR